MRASNIILNSVVCRQASKNIHPSDPDELFNEVWLKVREMEIRNPNWKPNTDPKHYFMRAMRNTKLKWIEREKRKHDHKVKPPEEAYGLDYERFMLQWLNEPTEDENLLFLKNIITLALYCKNINDACEACEMSRASFWKWRKIAEKRLKYDFENSDTYNIYNLDLV